MEERLFLEMPVESKGHSTETRRDRALPRWGSTGFGVTPGRSCTSPWVSVCGWWMGDSSKDRKPRHTWMAVDGRRGDLEDATCPRKFPSLSFFPKLGTLWKAKVEGTGAAPAS